MSELHPNSTVLGIIFPNEPSPKVFILAQTFTVCTFLASHRSGEDVVRLELGDESTLLRLCTIATLQRVAALAIPHLNPETKRIGQGKMEGGQDVYFSVIAYVGHSTTLEEAWNDIDDAQLLKIMGELQNVMNLLHSLNLNQVSVKSLPLDEITIGSPSAGYFPDIASLLKHVARSLKLGTGMLTQSNIDGGITVKGNMRGKDSTVHLSSEALGYLSKNCSLCHNDIEPRNCLAVCHNKDLSYSLAAIINWEMSGFYPWVYEIVTKRYFLGSSNLYLPWYTSIVSAVTDVTPHEKEFACALDLMYCMREEKDVKSCAVGKVFRWRWIAREGLVRNEDPFLGWENVNSVTGAK